MSVARKNPQFARQLLNMIGNEINRDTDKKRLENIIDELKGIVSDNQPQAQTMPQTPLNHQHG